MWSYSKCLPRLFSTRGSWVHLHTSPNCQYCLYSIYTTMHEYLILGHCYTSIRLSYVFAPFKVKQPGLKYLLCLDQIVSLFLLPNKIGVNFHKFSVQQININYTYDTYVPHENRLIIKFTHQNVNVSIYVCLRTLLFVPDSVIIIQIPTHQDWKHGSSQQVNDVLDYLKSLSMPPNCHLYKCQGHICIPLITISIVVPDCCTLSVARILNAVSLYSPQLTFLAPFLKPT